MKQGQVTIYILVGVFILFVYALISAVPTPKISPAPVEPPIGDQNLVQACIQEMAEAVVTDFATMGSIEPVDVVDSSWGVLGVFTQPTDVPTIESSADDLTQALTPIVLDCALEVQDEIPLGPTIRTLISEEALTFTVTMPVQIHTLSGTTTLSDFFVKIDYPVPLHLRLAREAVTAFDTEGYINLSKLSTLDAEFELAQLSLGTHLVSQIDPITETIYQYAVRPK
ncbi:hypothetical protein HY641_00360 [Candidatus Woesearchaeota archaeon]|nr:hypothetical protein [Candidatus Woesearchaeota archaeon]